MAVVDFVSSSANQLGELDLDSVTSADGSCRLNVVILATGDWMKPENTEQL